MSSFVVKGGEAERASEYRRRAESVLGHAAATRDVRTRSWFIDIANNYLALAEHIEQRLARRAANEGSRATEHRAQQRQPQHVGAAK